MPDQKPTLEYDGPTPRRERTIIFLLLRGIVFAYIVALAVLGILWTIGALVTIRNH